MQDELVPIFHTRKRNKYQLFTQEFRDKDVLPCKTEVKQGKYVKFISRAKGNFRKQINHKT